MNDSEARRKELLRQTRKLYSDNREIPAVQPRYGRIYHDLYKDGDTSGHTAGSTFYIRLAIGIFCFVCFVYMDQSRTKVANVDSRAIINEIEKNVDADTIREVWKAL